MSFPIYRTIAKVAFAPKLTITVCGTLQAQVVFESNGEFLCVKTSEETMMEQVLKTKVNKIYPFEGNKNMINMALQCLISVFCFLVDAHNGRPL